MDSENKYYTQVVDAVVQALETDPNKGLAGNDVRKRLDEHGQNIVEEKKQISAIW